LDYVFALILVMAPNCIDDDLSSRLDRDLNYNNTGYEPYLSPGREVVCIKGASIHSIESVTLPLLRQVYPDEPIVFVYGEKQERDYQLYVSAKYGPQNYKKARGNADVGLGYAIAPFSHADIQHERAHLELCGTHEKGSDAHDPSTWTRAASSRPWCRA
jgi:hypothetical protein